LPVSSSRVITSSIAGETLASPQWLCQSRRRTIASRSGSCEPEDIADPILFLAGDSARMITGVTLNVDGGVLVKNDTPYEEYFRRR
jgi:NAD(P)-dependent dehydrogenase (short-subunit alcohol dehydrogenase family)